MELVHWPDCPGGDGCICVASGSVLLSGTQRVAKSPDRALQMLDKALSIVHKEILMYDGFAVECGRRMEVDSEARYSEIVSVLLGVERKLRQYLP